MTMKDINLLLIFQEFHTVATSRAEEGDMAMIARVHPFKPSEQSTNGQHGQSVHNGQNTHYRIEDVTDDPKVALGLLAK
jgi:hypothetical protein